MADKPRTFLICGGTSRAGLDVARILAGGGHKCVVGGRKPPADAPAKSDLIYEHVDFAAPQSVMDFCARIVKNPLYMIDACVFFQRSRSEDVLESTQVSVVASAAIVKALEPKLSASGGAVTFIASVLGEKIGKEQSLAYHVSKGALAPLVRYLAVQYGGRFRVNAISLSTLKHSGNARGYDPGTPLHRIVEKVIPIGRPTTTEDVANVIIFLSGDGAAAITGQMIDVDGGLGVMSQVSSAIQTMG